MKHGQTRWGGWRSLSEQCKEIGIVTVATEEGRKRGRGMEDRKPR